MSLEINQLVDRIRQLEAELEVELAKRAEDLRIRVYDDRIAYTEDILSAHRALKTGLLRDLLDASPLKLITAPLIYGIIVPLVLLDVTVTVYQAICFPIYHITKVQRRDYLIFDRGGLAYLNAVEKLNCAYCSYGNGLIGYVREIAARTEQYWCPIKHAKRVKSAHSRYSRFVDYGDAQGFRDHIEDIRRDFEE